ncbi:MAG: hypothetical protein DKM22_05320 [Candidatus Melainabacteria bacterium]|nr:MAG: hypothetical protein DKM22_05320 [Candidatus Melainabacteria bacterium]
MLNLKLRKYKVLKQGVGKMPEYLTKEEVKQWRSSLEKITLEEYAARLGKVLEEEKHTNDLIDIVMKGQPVVSRIETPVNTEKISTVAKKSFDREKEISKKSFSAPEVKKSKPAAKVEKTEKIFDKENELADSNIVFLKPLTEREQKVFDLFYQHKSEIVYAKDLAELLNLPRDYVYKYIKTLRAKIQGDKLKNASNGGYMLTL